MLLKTIKTVFGICTVALFLSACTTTSTTDGSETETGSEATRSGSDSSATTGGSDAAVALETVVYFDFDSSSLRSESRALLNAHAAELKASPRSIRLEGHADERGTREYNIALGERRALAVSTYLQSQGVTSPIEVVSYGEERPAVDASNDYAWSQNRRVEIK